MRSDQRNAVIDWTSSSKALSKRPALKQKIVYRGGSSLQVGI